MWGLIICYLSLAQYDKEARLLTHILMLNCLIGQFFKRFFYRKRPFFYQPARAFSLTVQRSSSTPSRVVMVGTTMMYSVARCANESDQMHYFMCILTAAVAFLILMWMRSHLGSCYPSDCLLAIVPIALIIGFSELINATDYIYGCQDSCNDKVCYYNPDQVITQKIVPIDLDSFNLGSLNKYIILEKDAQLICLDNVNILISNIYDLSKNSKLILSSIRSKLQ
eukprot:403365542